MYIQTCETVPVTANNPVPKKQCFKKPRKVNIVNIHQMSP